MTPILIGRLDTTKLPYYLMGLLYGNGTGEALEYNAPLWFLTCDISLKLMVAAICCILKRITNERKKWGAILLSSLIVGWLLYEMFHVTRIPYELKTAVYMMPFYAFGVILQKSEKIFYHC